ncbi:MAG: membrane integrity-associated transporter subunit PqiC [Alphaproteobacteria bacterium]|nr:membrane integrity-associated transporter subunit PqiC [Alphaproteobacteria bacterium]
MLKRRADLLLSFVLLLSACGPLLKPAEITQNIYTLNIPKELPPVRKAASLLIDAPSAPGSLDTTKIALKREANRFDYFADSQWVDRAPLMLHHLIVNTLEKSGPLTVSAATALGTETGYFLTVEIRDFQAEYAGRQLPEIHIGLAVRLHSLPERQLIAAHVFEEKIPADANTMQAVVNAFDSGLQRLLAGLTSWTTEKMK